MQLIGRNPSFALTRPRAGRWWMGAVCCLLTPGVCWLVALSALRPAIPAQGETDTAPRWAVAPRPAAESGSPGTPAQTASRPEAESLRDELARLIQQLDAETYDVRRGAAGRLDELCERPELAPALAAEVRRALLRVDLSFEVRSRLERWASRLPEVGPGPAEPAPGPEDLDQVVEHLQSPSFAVRQAAAQRLEWLLGDPRLAGALLNRLKGALAQSTRHPDTWRSLETAWHRVRGAWLLAGAPEEELPVPSTTQINAWVNTLAGAAPEGESPGEQLALRLAQIELLDALARDRYMPAVREALDARLRESPNPEAASRLAKLLELTQPALVAEFWQGRQHLGEQHLLVGVPSLADGATRPSHFDRIDDRTAHCVSGQTLAPGDYPVGVAFPNPQLETAFFHLVNLPTPRQRMAYAYQVQAEESQRLRAISRRTLDRFLGEKRLLSEAELVMLAQLDPEEVSRFAGHYLLLVDDQPLPSADGPQRIGGRPSRHGLLCGILAAGGTQSAVAGLLGAIDRHAFLPPTSVAPYRLEYVAALAIARRDPWPQADRWLARQIGQREPLIDGRATGPELGATAAAILVERHRQPASEFGLQAAADPLLLELGIPGHRFATERDRRCMEQWWERVSELRQAP